MPLYLVSKNIPEIQVDYIPKLEVSTLDLLTNKSTKIQEIRNFYSESLKHALNNNMNTILFPLINKKLYLNQIEIQELAMEIIKTFLLSNDLDIYLVAEENKTNKSLTNKIDDFIKHNLLENFAKPLFEQNIFKQKARKNFLDEMVCNEVLDLKPLACGATLDIGSIFGNLDESFPETLLRLIDSKGKTDVEVYRRANIDRRLFSKIRSGNGYMPSKRTIIALAISLELSFPEAESLLKCAGFAFSRSQKFDVVIEFFILNKVYDIFTINEILFQYDLPLLGIN